MRRDCTQPDGFRVSGMSLADHNLLFQYM